MAWLRTSLVCLTTLAIAGLFAHVQAPGARISSDKKSSSWDTRADSWPATDALGRKLPTYEEVGPPRKDRFVGVFYFLWLGSFNGDGPFDVTQIIQKDSTAMLHPESPLWGPVFAPHHWGQSIFGYYLNDDEFVLRKHAQMLSDAGVDVIIFDTSNDITYKSQYKKLLQVFTEIRAEGGKTPQIAFLCPFWDPSHVVHELYHDLYAPGLYKDLWFRWKGKPLIMADPDLVGDHKPISELGTPWDLDPGKTLGQTFVAKSTFDSVGGRTFTYAKKGTAMTLSLFQGGPGGKKLASKRFENVLDNHWTTLELKKPMPPGDYYLEMSDPKGRLGWWSEKGSGIFGGNIVVNGRNESGALSLDLDTNAESGVPIRDFFTFRAPQPSYFEGPTKPNMWSWLEVYPQHIFKSSKGTREQMSVGVAQNAVSNRLGSMSEPGAHGRNWHGNSNDETPGAIDRGLNFAEQADHALKEDPEFVFVTGWNEWIAGRFPEFAGVKAPVMFVDEYNQEYSRDIEPMVGGHGDNYYYQLVSFVRRYKGMRPPPTAGRSKTIDISGGFSQWADVQPTFRDDVGDTAHRDHPGWNPATRYTNTTGRNDFVALKVSRDSEFLYFYAQTKDAITPFTDPHWMMLFLNVGPGKGANWQGYQFVLNRTSPDGSTCTLERRTDGGDWSACAKVRYRVTGNEMQLAIRRADLGLTDLDTPLRLEFKWADNIQKEGDIAEFITNGDVAPNGRFNYLYLEPKPNGD